MIVKVPKQDVDFVWKDCKPFLEKALDDTYSLDDIYEGIQKDFFQLWISWQGGVECAVITEMAEYPQKKILRYFLAGGKNLGHWLTDIQNKIEDLYIYSPSKIDHLVDSVRGSLQTMLDSVAP